MCILYLDYMDRKTPKFLDTQEIAVIILNLNDVV